MNKIRNILKTYFTNKEKSKITGTLGFTMIFLGVILSQIISFASLEPIKSITIESENLSYENNEPASWQITKSAKWISKGKTRITIELDTLVKTNNVDTDVILVLDTSGSMNGERLDKLKTDTTSLISNILSNENNNLALITFSTDSKIINNFTQDSETLIESINNLEAIGNTNYYQALVNVDNILKNYTWEDSKDCIVLFLTDGYPNEDSPNEIAQYNYLKTTYPYLTINSIQYEMGEEQLEVLKNISDNQYNANIDNLETYLYRASMSPLSYENFEIIDYINTEYFTITDISNISSKTGKTNLEDNKITWNLDKINSGSNHTMTIDIKLKDEFIGIGEVFQTNKKTEVISLIESNEENISTEKTLILADTYKIMYEENTPDDCNVSNIPKVTNASVFDIVEISSQIPTCDGYKFKEWKIINNIEKINDSSFIMPEEDVILRATWTRLSSNKSMEGKVSLVQNLYQMMADNSVPDNIASEFVSLSTGIDYSKTGGETNGKGIYQAVKKEGENTPIYYYRGAVDNNNLIFANFCWKIVRTTETKGVKLIYNGIPNEDGSCTATGDDSEIMKSDYLSKMNSLAYAGYMYGNAYELSTVKSDVTGLGGKEEYTNKDINQTNYIYSSNITYDELTNLYTLVDGTNKIWSDTYSVDTGNKNLYTCFSETENTCSTIYFITQSTNVNQMYYTSFSNGEKADEILNKELIYGNDILYDESTGLYTLQKTYKNKISEWQTNRNTISGPNGYHYTCLSESSACENIYYISWIIQGNERGSDVIYYATFSSGINVDSAVKEMTTETSHTEESVIKTKIDNWYEENLIDYSNYLEDTTWCNDRTISKYTSWNKDNGFGQLSFQTYDDMISSNIKITCRNKNDAYTVSDTTNGNGMLTYPIALLTIDEVIYAGTGRYEQSTYLATNSSWWTMSPGFFNVLAGIQVIGGTGNIGYSYGHNVNGIRPSISLKEGARSIDGDGTPENPFIVE